MKAFDILGAALLDWRGVILQEIVLWASLLGYVGHRIQLSRRLLHRAADRAGLPPRWRSATAFACGGAILGLLSAALTLAAAAPGWIAAPRPSVTLATLAVAGLLGATVSLARPRPPGYHAAQRRAVRGAWTGIGTAVGAAGLVAYMPSAMGGAIAMAGAIGRLLAPLLAVVGPPAAAVLAAAALAALAELAVRVVARRRARVSPPVAVGGAITGVLVVRSGLVAAEPMAVATCAGVLAGIAVAAIAAVLAVRAVPWLDLAQQARLLPSAWLATRRARRAELRDLPRPLKVVARLTGVLYATTQLAAVYSSLVVTLLALEIRESVDGVQLVTGLTGGAAIPVVLYYVWRPTRLPGPITIGLLVVALGGTLIALGAAPSLWMFALSSAAASGIGPIALLFRHETSSWFHPDEGGFGGIVQAWNFPARALGGFAFTLALLAGADFTTAAIAFGALLVASGVAHTALLLLGRPADAAPIQPTKPMPLLRLLDSPQLKQGQAVFFFVYALFGVFWAETQPRLEEVGFDGQGASVLTAVFGLSVVLSVDALWTYSRKSDRDAEASATSASGRLCAVTALGLLTPLVSSQWPAALAIAAYSTGIERFANSTTSAVNAGLSKQKDPRVALLSGLTRSASAIAAGVVTSLVGWNGGVLSMLAFALLAMVSLLLWAKHPTGRLAWSRGTGSLRVRLAEADSGDPLVKCRLIVEEGTDDDARTIVDWDAWPRDRIDGKGVYDPSDPRDQRIRVLQVKVIPLERTRRWLPVLSRGYLHKGARVTLMLGTAERATLVWRSWQFGRWTRNPDGSVTLSAWPLQHAINFVELRHGRPIGPAVEAHTPAPA